MVVTSKSCFLPAEMILILYPIKHKMRLIQVAFPAQVPRRLGAAARPQTPACSGAARASQPLLRTTPATGSPAKIVIGESSLMVSSTAVSPTVASSSVVTSTPTSSTTDPR